MMCFNELRIALIFLRFSGILSYMKRIISTCWKLETEHYKMI